jgi:hypothetical protein
LPVLVRGGIDLIRLIHVGSQSFPLSDGDTRVRDDVVGCGAVRLLVEFAAISRSASSVVGGGTCSGHVICSGSVGCLADSECLRDPVCSSDSELDDFLHLFGSGPGLSIAFLLVEDLCQSGLSAASNKACMTSGLGADSLSALQPWK